MHLGVGGFFPQGVRYLARSAVRIRPCHNRSEGRGAVNSAIYGALDVHFFREADAQKGRCQFGVCDVLTTPVRDVGDDRREFPFILGRVLRHNRRDFAGPGGVGVGDGGGALVLQGDCPFRWIFEYSYPPLETAPEGRRQRRGATRAVLAHSHGSDHTSSVFAVS